MPDVARLELHGPAAQSALTAGAVLVPMRDQPVGPLIPGEARGEWWSRTVGRTGPIRWCHTPPYLPGSRLVLVLHLPDGVRLHGAYFPTSLPDDGHDHFENNGRRWWRSAGRWKRGR